MRADLQVVLPLAPGVESVWQPVQEELDEAVATVRNVLDENLENLQVSVRFTMDTCWLSCCSAVILDPTCLEA